MSAEKWKARVDRAYRETFMRPANAHERRKWSALLPALLLRRRLKRTSEFNRCAVPLMARVDELHRRYAHAAPSPQDVQDAFARVRTGLHTQDEIVTAIQDGTVRRKLGIRPLKLEMDVTTQCNLRCTMCYLSDPRYGKRERADISVEDFRKLARQVFPHCGLVSLSFGTEPLLHPRLAELLEITAEEEVPWRYLTTNGLLLDERLIEAFVRVPLHGFSVSIDAATAATYERIRRGGRWDRLMANLRALQEAKRRAGSEYPRLTFNFVMMRSNLEELPALVRLAHELGAEGIAAVHLTAFDGLGVDDELLHREPERCNAVLTATRAEAARLSMTIALPEPFDLESRDPRVLKAETPRGHSLPEHGRARVSCPFPWQFVGIDPYGKVLPCGWWYSEQPMGDVRTQAFDEIWEGTAWRELRREHATGELRPSCRRCPAAGMGSCDNPHAFGTVQLGPPDTTPRAPRTPDDKI